MQKIQKLSIIIPAYNESPTIIRLLDSISSVVLAENIEKEIVIVDDGSSDATGKLIEEYCKHHSGNGIVYLKHEKNMGKGVSIRTGIHRATGDYIVIQDADLEYDPAEYNLLLKPILDGHADVVYGTRFYGGKPHRILFFWHTIGNKIITFLSNIFTNLNLSDIETGYKIFKKEHLKKMNLKEERFGFEPEVTAKISKIPGIRIYEVGISYYGRTYSEGKKIKWRDGFRAIYCIIKYNLFK